MKKLLVLLFIPFVCLGQGVAKYIVEDVVPLETNIKMEQTKVKRQPIYFNEHGYNHEFKQYSHKKACI